MSTLLQATQAPVAPTPAPDAKAVPPASGTTGAGLRAAAASAAATGLCGLSIGSPTLVLLALLVLVCLLLLRWLPADVVLPAAVCTLIFAATACGVVAAAAGVDLLARPRLLPPVLAAVLAALLFAVWRQPAQDCPGLSRGWALAQVPAAVVVALAVAQGFDVNKVAAWMFIGTDFAEHAVMLAQLQTDGALDYAAQSYPRGLHALLAGVSAVGLPPAGTSLRVAHDLQLMGAATWLLMAAFLSTISSVILRAAPALRLGRRGSVLTAGLTAVGVLYHGPFMLVFIPMAAAPGVAALLALWLVPLAHAALPPGRRRWLVVTLLTAMATVVLANVWQALAPVSAAGWLLSHASRGVRAEAAAAATWVRSRPLRLVGLAVLAFTSAALSVLPILGLLDSGGLGIAAIDAELLAPSLVLLVLGHGVVLGLAIRVPALRAACGVLLGLHAAITVLLISAGGGLDLSQYYPRKATWFLLGFVLPFAGLAVGAAAARACSAASQQIARLPRSRGAARALVTAVALALGVSFVLPQIVVAGSLATRAAHPAESGDARKLRIALQDSDGFAPLVAVPVALGLRPIPDRYDTYVISKLLRMKTGQPQTFGLVAQGCAAVKDVAQGAAAVVLTDLDADLLARELARQGCPDQRVVQIPGGHPGARALLERSLISGLKAPD